MLQPFDGVDMAQVSTGCFMMGGDDGDYDEKPVLLVCFDQSFWIDCTEVKNYQSTHFGGLAVQL